MSKIILINAERKCVLKLVSINYIDNYATFLKLNNLEDEETDNIFVNYPTLDKIDVENGIIIENYFLCDLKHDLTEDEKSIYNFKIFIKDSQLLDIIMNYQLLYEKVKLNKRVPFGNGIYIYLKTISEEINEYGVSDRYIIENLLQLKIIQL